MTDAEATIAVLRAENAALRRRLGERDDFLYQIGKLSRQYEASIAPEATEPKA